MPKDWQGYVTTKSGERLAFAAYVNHVALPDDPDAAQRGCRASLGRNSSGPLTTRT